MEREKIQQKAKTPIKDLTSGSPLKLILSFALPMYLGLLFQQFYNMVDTIIVGRYLGVDSFAGVGATQSINFMVLGFCIGLCSGFAVLVAQRFGAKDYEGLRKMVANSIWLCVVFGIIITFFVVLYCRKILQVMDTPEDIFENAYQYIRIIFIGIPFLILYNITAAIIRSLGDSKTPIYFLAISSVLNILLDLLFIVVIGMDVEGAALATVIAQGSSGIICAIYMKKKFQILKMEKGDMKIRPQLMGKLVGIGVPMGLQYSITAIGSVVLQTAMNGLGSIYVAALTAGNKIHTLLVCPLDALGQTMAPYAGQNVGAGKLDRVGKGLKCAVGLGVLVSVVDFIMILLFGKKLTLIFMDEPNMDVVNYAYRFLLVVSAAYILLTLVNTVRFCIQGMGYSTFAICAGVLEMVARIIGGLVLVPWLGYVGGCMAHPLAWLFADLFLIPAFFICKKRCIKNTVMNEA